MGQGKRMGMRLGRILGIGQGVERVEIEQGMSVGMGQGTIAEWDKVKRMGIGLRGDGAG